MLSKGSAISQKALGAADVLVSSAIAGFPLARYALSDRSRIKANPYGRHGSKYDPDYKPSKRSLLGSALLYGAAMPAGYAAGIYSAKPISRLFPQKNVKMRLWGDVMSKMAPTFVNKKTLATLGALGAAAGLSGALRHRLIDRQVARARGIEEGRNGLQKMSSIEKEAWVGALLGGLAAVTPIISKALPYIGKAMPAIKGAFRGAKGLSGLAGGMKSVWQNVARPMGRDISKWWKQGPTFRPTKWTNPVRSAMQSQAPAWVD